MVEQINGGIPIQWNTVNTAEKKNVPFSDANTWMKCKCILLCEKIQSVKSM